MPNTVQSHTAETPASGTSGLIVALLPLSLFLFFASLIERVVAGEIITYSIPWAPSLDVALSFYIDGFALLFALIVTGIGTLIFIYASGYMAGDRQFVHIYLYLSLFMLSMVGVVTADNIIFLFIAWELTSITSYLLIGFKHEYEDSRTSALQALVITGAGGLALLAGLILLGIAGGSWELSVLLHQEGGITAHPLYTPAFILILIGAITKSAQVPFHFWLPNAMAAPTPISAYLHSATMVKAGVFLLARLSPILSGTDSWLWSVTGFGAVTMLFGAYQATFQTDLKRILAYTTVSGLGILTFLIGIGTKEAIQAAVVFLVVHALYKGALFMVAGAIDHESGTRNIDELGGLARLMPVTFVAAVLVGVSMSGIPPMLGFLGKEFIYKAALYTKETPLADIMFVLVAMAIVTKVFTMVAAGLVALKPFTGPTVQTPKHVHEAPWSMWLGPLALGALSLAMGLMLEQVGGPLLESAMGAILGDPHFHAHHLSLLAIVEETLTEGVTLVLALSLATIVAGALVYQFGQGALRTIGQQTSITWGPEAWYTRVFHLKNGALIQTAKWQTKVLQHGKLPWYVSVAVIMTIILTGVAMITRMDMSWSSINPWPDIQQDGIGLAIITVIIACLIIVGTIAIMVFSKVLARVAALGVVGYGVAVLFILFSAPDLAITQFAIETLTVILFVLVFYRLPTAKRVEPEKPAENIVDAIAAIAIGLFMMVLMLYITAQESFATLHPSLENIKNYFLDASVPLAKGQNVVNVILVDFRAFDTLGEIVVLGIAAIGVVALLQFTSSTDDDESDSSVQSDSSDRKDEFA